MRHRLRLLLKGRFIKVPWVMMSINKKEKNPKSLLLENTYRMNHDLRHPNKIFKFRCKYETIEVKCIFKTAKYNAIWDHFPKEPIGESKVVDSVKGENQPLDGFHHNLREVDIESGILLCYHFRIISQENNLNKIKNNFWYIQNGYSPEDLMSADYPEIIDETLKNKKLKLNSEEQ